MSSVAAMASKDKLRILETVLSSPGMADKCKLSLQLSRHTILLLGRLIEAGLGEQATDELMAVLPKDSLEELRALQDEILQKGALTDFYHRLKTL